MKTYIEKADEWLLKNPAKEKFEASVQVFKFAEHLDNSLNQEHKEECKCHCHKGCFNNCLCESFPELHKNLQPKCRCELKREKSGFSHDSECPLFVDDRKQEDKRCGHLLHNNPKAYCPDCEPNQKNWDKDVENYIRNSPHYKERIDKEIKKIKECKHEWVQNSPYPPIKMWCRKCGLDSQPKEPKKIEFTKEKIIEWLNENL